MKHLLGAEKYVLHVIHQNVNIVKMEHQKAVNNANQDIF